MASGRQPPNNRPCDAETLDGRPCRGWALRGSLYCLSHDPEHQDEVRAARSRGGARSSRVQAIRGHYSRLDTMPALVKFTARIIQDVLSDEPLDPTIARTVLYGLSIQRSLVEASDLDARLRVVEERLRIRRAS